MPCKPSAKNATLPEALKVLNQRQEYYAMQLGNGVILDLDEDDWSATCLVNADASPTRLKQTHVLPENIEHEAQKLAIDESWKLVAQGLKAQRANH
jgi:hypothetical protein